MGTPDLLQVVTLFFFEVFWQTYEYQCFSSSSAPCPHFLGRCTSPSLPQSSPSAPRDWSEHASSDALLPPSPFLTAGFDQARAVADPMFSQLASELPVHAGPPSTHFHLRFERFSSEFAISRYERSKLEHPHDRLSSHQLARRSSRTNQSTGQPIAPSRHTDRTSHNDRTPGTRARSNNSAPCIVAGTQRGNRRTPSSQSYAQSHRTDPPSGTAIARTSRIEWPGN